MPWREVTALNERMEFVARLKGRERMTDLCRAGYRAKPSTSLSSAMTSIVLEAWNRLDGGAVFVRFFTRQSIRML